MRTIVICLCTLFAFSASVARANYFCTGVVAAVDVSPSGLLVVDSPDAGLRSFYICQIGATNNGVGPDACKAILAVVLASRTTGLPVDWGFSDSLTCSTHPSWTYLTGWYYGPNLHS
jgi:hypothetical protein